ncbi:MAG: alpha/beta hydrolase [Pseudomonadota bacterium]
MSSTYQGQDIRLEIFGRTIAAKRWGNSSGPKFMALHGWLDNANTFERLAPLLPELNLVALDFAGHGYSDHRAPGAHYHQIDDVQDVIAAAQVLGWDRFGLIGHSMGAQISAEVSCLFPSKIEQCVLIDGMLCTGELEMQERVEHTREGLTKMLTSHIKPKIFSDVAAMAERVTQATDQSFEAASALVERGHIAVEGGVTWCTDPRIRYPSPLRPSREYIDALLVQCEVNSLLVVANQGDSWYRSEVDHVTERHPKLTVQRMDGPHHVHLEPKHYEEVGRRIREFLGL